MSEISARRSVTRDKLVEAALEVFAEKGVGGASVEEISEAAGFTRGAFYSNFESKDDLCLAALDRFASGGLAATQDAIASLDRTDVPSLEDLVEHAIRVFLGAQRADRVAVLAHAELRLYAARTESFAGPYAAHLESTNRTFARILSDAAARFGRRLTLPAPDVVDILAAVYLHGAVAAILANSDEASDVPQRLGAVLASMLQPV